MLAPCSCLIWSSIPLTSHYFTGTHWYTHSRLFSHPTLNTPHPVPTCHHTLRKYTMHTPWPTHQKPYTLQSNSCPETPNQKQSNPFTSLINNYSYYTQGSLPVHVLCRSANDKLQLTHEQVRIIKHDVKTGQIIKIVAFAGKKQRFC